MDKNYTCGQGLPKGGTNKILQRSHFQCGFNDFGFLVDITPRVINGSLRHFMGLGPGHRNKGFHFGKNLDVVSQGPTISLVGY